MDQGNILEITEHFASSIYSLLDLHRGVFVSLTYANGFARKGTLSTSVDVPEALCSQEDHTSGKLKRRLSEGGEGGEGMEVGGCEAAEVEGLATKRLRNTEPSSSSSLEENDPLNTQLAARLNFPLANEQGPPCLVKVSLQ